MEVIYLSLFPNNSDEISLIKFISKYQYLSVKDAKYFFGSSRYYRNRIKKLIDKNILRKIKWVLVLGKSGIEYTKLMNFEYNRINTNKKYMQRLLRVGNIGAFYHNSETIKFTPSFCIKNKNSFTLTARRYIGVLEINGIEYLTYQITKEHDKKYIYSVIYDIQKESYYKNIILLVDNINRIELNNFIFGINQVLIIEDNENNRKKLEFLNSININELTCKLYKNKVYLAEYNFCDYTDYNNKYVSYFYFIDTEKISKIRYFLRENKKSDVEIICSKEIVDILKKELSEAKFIIIDFKEFIQKQRIFYS